MARSRYDRAYIELQRDKVITNLRSELAGKREVIERQRPRIDDLEARNERLQARVDELERAAQGALL